MTLIITKIFKYICGFSDCSTDHAYENVAFLYHSSCKEFTEFSSIYLHLIFLFCYWPFKSYCTTSLIIMYYVSIMVLRS